MAETYSTEYTAAFITTPPGNTYAYRRGQRSLDFTYTQVLAGAANDTIVLGRLPIKAKVVMWESWIEWDTFTATATLSIGWRAYKDEDGVTVAASPAGLLSAVLLTANGGWSHGMLVVATPDDSIPVVGRKVFNNREEVPIVATIGVAAPGIGAHLNGGIAFYVA